MSDELKSKPLHWPVVDNTSPYRRVTFHTNETALNSYVALVRSSDGTTKEQVVRDGEVISERQVVLSEGDTWPNGDTWQTLKTIERQPH